MKIKLIFIIVFCLLLLPGNLSVFAQEIPADYLIISFESAILVNKDTSVEVTETIDVNFSENRHGIYRDIPTVHSGRGRNIITDIEVESVVDEQGKSYIYEVSHSTRSIRIKIGDPDVFVFGRKVYKIIYKSRNVLRSYDGYDELYWNVTGPSWDTDILEAAATVSSPYADIFETSCYAGILGSSARDCAAAHEGGNAIFSTDLDLGPGRDFTLVAKFNPDNNLVYPAALTQIWWFFSANWGYLVAIIPFFVMFFFWYKRGRDRRYISHNVYYKPENAKSRTVALFERPYLPLVYHPIDGLSPAEVGTIIDGKVDTHDVVAEIVELGRLGFITIEKIEKERLFGKGREYTFTKTKKFTDENVENLKGYQKVILEELFKVHGNSIKLSDLKRKFYKSMSDVKEKLYEEMSSEGFFAGNPEKTRVKWFLIFAALEALAFFLLVSHIEFNLRPLVIFIVFSLVGVGLAYSMPSRTPKGYSLYRQIDGLKFYLKTGKWRYEHMEKNLFIEEILPLAIALRVVDKLASDMKELGMDPPKYFAGTTAAAFASDINHFYSTSASSLTSTPSGGSSGWSGGSGFSGGSGGGFGGGGGGSW